MQIRMQIQNFPRDQIISLIRMFGLGNPPNAFWSRGIHWAQIEISSLDAKLLVQFYCVFSWEWHQHSSGWSSRNNTESTDKVDKTNWCYKLCRSLFKANFCFPLVALWSRVCGCVCNITIACLQAEFQQDGTWTIGRVCMHAESKSNAMLVQCA